MWSLVHALYSYVVVVLCRKARRTLTRVPALLRSDRLLPPPLPSTASALLALSPYTPPLTLIQHIISHDPELSELHTVYSHLMTPDPFRTPFGLVERREGYWSATAGLVRRSKSVGPGRQSLARGFALRHLFSSSDPPFTNVRQTSREDREIS